MNFIVLGFLLNVFIDSTGYIDLLPEEDINCAGLVSYGHVLSELIPGSIYCLFFALSFGWNCIIKELWGPDLRAGFWWANGFSWKLQLRICSCCQSDWCIEEKYVLLLGLMYSFIVALKCPKLQNITHLWYTSMSVSASLFQFLIYQSGLGCVLRFHISVLKNVFM